MREFIMQVKVLVQDSIDDDQTARELLAAEMRANDGLLRFHFDVGEKCEKEGCGLPGAEPTVILGVVGATICPAHLKELDRSKELYAIHEGIVRAGAAFEYAQAEAQGGAAHLEEHKVKVLDSVTSSRRVARDYLLGWLGK